MRLSIDPAPEDQGNPRPGGRGADFSLAALCFFLSGGAALLYEVVWVRLLGLVFGHTVHAVTTVLAVYMGGLALGSMAAGRWADRVRRPLRAYALIEAAIGLYCAATPLLFALTEGLYLRIHRAAQPGALGALALHFALAALVLLPPTALMGATLPLLSRAVVRDPRLAATGVGLLYAANTWGAVAGAASTGFALLPAIGLSRTVWLGVAVDLLVAGLALLLDRRAAAGGTAPAPGAAAGGPEPEAPAGAGAAPARTPLQVRVALVAVGVSGAAAMAYEVSWTRALSMALGSSTYAFTAMLTTFLAGLALGAAAAARWLRGARDGLTAFGVVEGAIAALAVALLPAFGRLPEALLAVLGRTGVSHGAALGAQFGLGFLVMVGPTLLLGATFPLVVSAVGTGVGRLGREVGLVYGANTIGTILGSAAAGFALIPALGIQSTVLVAAVANLAAGAAALAVARAPGRRAWGALAATAAVVVALAAGAPRWDPKMMTSGVPIYAREMVKGGAEAVRESARRRELLFYREGLSTTVAVTRTPTAVSLSVNGKTDASNTRDMATQLLLGHLGAVLHPAPRSALVIGLASGVTAGAVAQHPVERVDVAEIEPAMAEASAFFRAENRDVLSDPRVRVLEGDGRQILAAATAPYDLIISEPSNPWIAGVASLFTREFYESARRSLAPGGVMVQWLQAYSIFTRDMQMVVRTFQQVFPHVSVWEGSLGDVLLVATPAEACLDAGLLAARLAASPGLRQDFEAHGWAGEGLAFRLVLGEADARRYAEGAPLNTDDLPLLEFSAPLALYTSSADENKAAMRAFRRQDRPCTAGLDAAELAGPAGRVRAARSHHAEGRLEDAALELDRSGPPAPRPWLGERARLRLLLGHLEEAWADAAALPPSDPGAGPLRAALAALGDPRVAPRLAAALEARQQRWFADPGRFGELLVNLGLERRDPGLVALGREELELARRLHPGRTPVLVNLGIALATLGEQQAGLAALRRALELDPADARTHLNAGTLLEKMGRVPEAARHYQEALRLQPGWQPAAMRLQALGQPAAR